MSEDKDVLSELRVVMWAVFVLVCVVVGAVLWK